MYIAIGGDQISHLTTAPPEKGTVHIGYRTPKILIGTMVKISAVMCPGKCEHGGRSIVTQVCGEGGDEKSVVK